ncbi:MULTISPECIES: Chromate resistance protein ChrB [unclassified Cryobacterium]|uniref:Chromate resistance protein ChrB n=1 Tax=unclassified Cryobacterium TaxID=2649013 RepID=UPI003417AF83
MRQLRAGDLQAHVHPRRARGGEQSSERLQRWCRDLNKRDVLHLPEAKSAEQRLHGWVEILHG